MKRWRLLVTAGALVIISGCASQTDFDAHEADYNGLRAEFDYLRTNLRTWSAEVYDWQNKTYVVICDIKTKNVPETAYAAETEIYCGAGEGTGVPDPPPDWGPPQE
jgi:uncharacterized protein YceK